MHGHSASFSHHRASKCHSTHLPRHEQHQHVLQHLSRQHRGDALICSSRSARDFNHHFNPPLPPEEVRQFGYGNSMSRTEKKTQQQPANQFTSLQDEEQQEAGPDSRYWRGVPPDTMTPVRNRHAQNARVALRQKPTPAPGMLGIVFPIVSPLLPSEEALDVELEHNYSSDWPSIAYNSNGQPSVRRGETGYNRLGWILIPARGSCFNFWLERVSQTGLQWMC